MATVTHLAARQHGVVHHRQAVDAGLTDRQIHRLVRDAYWIRLTRGVYRIAGAPLTFHTQLKAATLATPSGRVSDAAAAGLHELTGFGPIWPELTVGSGQSARSLLATVHRRAIFRSTRVQGIPVGTIDQTIVDLAGTIPYRRLEAATDDALLDRRLHVRRLEDQAVLHDRSRSPGIGDLRRLVAARSDGEPVAQSDLERDLRIVLDHPGIPEVTWQYPLPWAPPGTGFADAFIERWMLIVEADGRRWHTRCGDFPVDRSRDREALTIGIATARFSHGDLTIDRAATLDTLLRIGAERSRLLGR